MSDSDSDVPLPKRRTLNKDEHIKVKEKASKTRGEEFVTTAGVLVPSKKTGPDCEC